MIGKLTFASSLLVAANALKISASEIQGFLAQVESEAEYMTADDLSYAAGNEVDGTSAPEVEDNHGKLCAYSPCRKGRRLPLEEQCHSGECSWMYSLAYNGDDTARDWSRKRVCMPLNFGEYFIYYDIDDSEEGENSKIGPASDCGF